LFTACCGAPCRNPLLESVYKNGQTLAPARVFPEIRTVGKGPSLLTRCAMATLICPKGHRWPGLAAAGTPVPCPVCGVAVAVPTALTLTPEERELEPTTDIVAPPPGAAPTAVLSPGTFVAGYEILGVLGRGGMGVVYKAVQPGLKRVVALKMIHGEALDASSFERFRREAEAIAQLQHPHIVQIHEIGEHEGRPFFS